MSTIPNSSRKNQSSTHSRRSPNRAKWLAYGLRSRPDVVVAISRASERHDQQLGDSHRGPSPQPLAL